MLTAHSPTQGITVAGPRMHHIGAYLARLCASALGLDLFQVYLDDPGRLKRLLPPGAPPVTVEKLPDFYQTLADYLLFSTDCLLHPATGQRLDKRDIILNTALVSGSDPVRLLARLDGCMGRVIYVEGHNRNWFASLLEEGLDSGVLLRFRGQGDEESPWAALAAFLRTRNDEPVIVSDAEGGDAFPTAQFGAPFVPPSLAGASVTWSPTPGVRPDWRDEDPLWLQWKAAVWDRLSLADQWAYALQGLRQFESHELELRPENWRTYRFGDGYNAFQLLAATYISHPL